MSVCTSPVKPVSTTSRLTCVRQVALLIVMSAVALTGCDAANEGETRSPGGAASVQEARESLPVGASSPFSIYTHCGFQFATIDGALRRTRLRDDGNGNPPHGWPGLVTGTIERVSKNRATFTGINVTVRAVFRPAPHAQYFCD